MVREVSMPENNLGSTEPQPRDNFKDLDASVLYLQALGLRLVYLHEVGFDELNSLIPGTFTAQVIESTKSKRNGRGAWGNGRNPSEAITRAVENYQRPKEVDKPIRRSLPNITLEDLDL